MSSVLYYECLDWVLLRTSERTGSQGSLEGDPFNTTILLSFTTLVGCRTKLRETHIMVLFRIKKDK